MHKMKYGVTSCWRNIEFEAAGCLCEIALKGELPTRNWNDINVVSYPRKIKVRAPSFQREIESEDSSCWSKMWIKAARIWNSAVVTQ